MPRSLTAAAPAALAIAALVTLAGCKRTADESATASAPAVEAPRSVEPLLAYVWNCDDGQTLRMTNLLRDNAISLELHEGVRNLPLVVSASGAKYSDGTLTFWSKGDTATFERAGSTPVRCSMNRYQSALADSRARGVRYRGTGNEPGWFAEVGPGSRLLWVTRYGAERHEFDSSEALTGNEPTVEVFRAGRDSNSLSVTVSHEPCADDMSGEAFDYHMVVESGGRTYRGCATALQ